MEFQDVVRRRRMVRNFTDQPVPADLLDRILDNAIRAPSAGFSQGWAFLVLDEAEAREKFWKSVWPGQISDPYSGMTKAPVIIVPLSHKQAYLDRYAEADKGWTDRSEEHWPVPYWDIDTGFASLMMLLTAVDVGLAAVFFGVPDQAGLRASFDVPEGYTAVGAIALGYGAPDVPSPSLKRGRRPVEQVVHRNGW